MPTLNDTNNNHSRTMMMSSSNDTNNNSSNKLSQRDLTPIPTTTTTTTTTTPATLNSNNNSINNHQNHVTNNHQRQINHKQVRSPRANATTITHAQPQQQQNLQHQQQIHQQPLDPQTYTRRKVEWQRRIAKADFKYNDLSDEELIELMKLQLIADYKLEYFLGKEHALRCVEIRRRFLKQKLELIDNNRAMAFNESVENETFEFEKINGACCENVIGYVRVPVGVAGPLKLDGEEYIVPLATTEGCLVASTKRGMSALNKSGGVRSTISGDFMTRAPIVRFTDPGFEGFNLVTQAKDWLEKNFELMRAAFERTSKHAKLLKYTCKSIHSDLHIRFEAYTGDAMGMNMCSKGAESALQEMKNAFPTMEIVSLSGNMCTDKKAAAINWINGRGKEVECFSVIPAEIVHSVLKVSVDTMIDRYNSKVMQGSAMAGTIGGFNCHAANIVTAIFIATGQDPAQSVTSSNCMLSLKKGPNGSLEVACYMPSIECGTVGGGTILRDQSRNLQMMGINGPTPDKFKVFPDGNNTNACTLARIICATVMAAELSLLAALTQNTLVKSHMRHNRSSTNVTMASDKTSTFS